MMTVWLTGWCAVGSSTFKVEIFKLVRGPGPLEAGNMTLVSLSEGGQVAGIGNSSELTFYA